MELENKALIHFFPSRPLVWGCGVCLHSSVSELCDWKEDSTEGVLVESQVINEGSYVREVSGLYAVMMAASTQLFSAQELSWHRSCVSAEARLQPSSAALHRLPPSPKLATASRAYRRLQSLLQPPELTDASRACYASRAYRCLQRLLTTASRRCLPRPPPELADTSGPCLPPYPEPPTVSRACCRLQNLPLPPELAAASRACVPQSPELAAESRASLQPCLEPPTVSRPCLSPPLDLTYHTLQTLLTTISEAFHRLQTWLTTTSRAFRRLQSLLTTKSRT